MDEMWLQVLSWIVGGAGVTGLVSTAVQGRREHRRWLRDQKKDAYATLLSYASTVRKTAVKLAYTAREVDEIQRIYASGNLRTPVKLPSLDHPSFKNFGDVGRAKDELHGRLKLQHREFENAMLDSSAWEGTMDLMAPKNVSHALSEFFRSMDGLGEHVLDAHSVRRNLMIAYDKLLEAVRSDFGTKDK